MMHAPPPPDEARRLQLLAELEVLDTPPEAGFDALTRAARLATGWPIALISLIDARRQWFKSRDGLAACETPREQAFCAHALVHGDALFEVPDAQADPRFADNPLVTGEPRIRAYAGQPLLVQGVRLGTLCLIHTAPARLAWPQRELLQALAEAASGLLAERLNRSRLALQRQRLADFGAASGDWLWETDAAHRVVWLSRDYEAASGEPVTALLGKPLPDERLMDARGLPLQPAVSLHELCGRGQRFSRAIISRPGPGGPRWISLSAVPARASAGPPSGMRGSARDITEQVLAERARDAEAQRLRLLVAQVPGMLYQFRLDAQGNASFPFSTPAMQTLFEVAPAVAEADAQAVFNRIHPDDLPRIQRSIDQSRAALTPWQATFRVQLPDGRERHLSAHSSPQREADGSVLWHGLVTDVTQQVLEREARERLQRERDRAQREAQARAEALSRVSHELRTPLNAILGFTQLMQAALRDDVTAPAAMIDPASGAAPAAWGPWVQQVHRAASHLLALVNDVLDVSSLEARRFVVDLQAVDAAQVARQVVEMVRPQALLRGQQLVCAGAYATLPDDRDPAGTAEAWVRADKRALRQVLINLLGNACKYTPEGGQVTLRWRTAEGRNLRLEVCDNGPGISEAQQARLFRLFERGDAADGATAGTGLGLVISRQLVRAMRGQLTLQSRPGHGSVFAVELPLAEPGTAAVGGGLSADSLFGGLPDSEPGQPEGTAALPPALLLYVEDDPVNGLLMQEFVARTPPLRLHLAANLAEGLAAARSIQPDLVLLDMHLPDGSGLDLLRQLRAEPSTHRLTVVALSADALPDQVRHAREAGFDDYWTKPVDFALLRRRLGTWLAR